MQKRSSLNPVAAFLALVPTLSVAEVGPAIDLVASTPEEKAAFIEADQKRVDLLKSYEAGFRYESFCGAWDLAEDGHLGIRGFSKRDDTIVVTMGRNLDSMALSKQLGRPSMGSLFGGQMIRAMGSCMDFLSKETPVSFTTSELTGCTLTFKNAELAENGCRDVATIEEIKPINP